MYEKEREREREREKEKERERERELPVSEELNNAKSKTANDVMAPVCPSNACRTFPV